MKFVEFTTTSEQQILVNSDEVILVAATDENPDRSECILTLKNKVDDLNMRIGVLGALSEVKAKLEASQ